MNFPDRETVERLRRKFPVGCRIVLDRMDDPYTNIPVGTQGTVIAVDDAGTVFPCWDNGGSLGVAYGEDSAHPVATEEKAKVTLDYLGTAQRKGGRYEDRFCPRCGAMMPENPALSRRADIAICSRCGQQEALEDAGLDEKLPLMHWKALRETQSGGGPWRG